MRSGRQQAALSLCCFLLMGSVIFTLELQFLLIWQLLSDVHNPPYCLHRTKGGGVAGSVAPLLLLHWGHDSSRITQRKTEVLVLSVVTPIDMEWTASLQMPREQIPGGALPQMSQRRVVLQGTRVSWTYASKGFSVHSNVNGVYFKGRGKSLDIFNKNDLFFLLIVSR